MKFILLSDIHLSWENSKARKDNLYKVQFEKLGFVFDWAEKINGTILSAADFFHRPRSWYLLPEVIAFLLKRQKTIYTVYGQHDTYLYSEATRDSTSLGILNKYGLVEIINNYYEQQLFLEDEDEERIVLFGCSYGQDMKDFDLNKVSKFKTKILVIHAPISTAPLFPGHNITYADKFLEKHKEFDLILCGDIHQSFIIEKQGRFIVNCGPLLRREATEYNYKHKPHFLVYDTEARTIDKVIIPHETASKVLSREHIIQEEQTELMLEDFIESVKTGEVESASFTENLWSFIKQNNIEQEIVNIISEVMEENK